MCRVIIQTIKEAKRVSQIKLISRDWRWCSSAPSFVVEHAFHLCVVGVLTLIHCSQTYGMKIDTIVMISTPVTRRSTTFLRCEGSGEHNFDLVCRMGIQRKSPVRLVPAA